MLRGFCKFGKLPPFFISVAIQFTAMSSQQQPPITVCKTFLRHDQDVSLYNNCVCDNVKIYAPKWVEESLEKIWPLLKGVEVQVYGGKDKLLLDTKILNDKITLWDLQILSRNEPWNTSGKIHFTSYEPKNKPLVLSLKDLVRQCVIVGSDETTHYGGYPSHLDAVPQKAKVYVCDLAGIQFQMEYNSGRLVLIGRENSFLPGELDDFIFEKVVGEKKKTFKQVERIQSERYVSTYLSRQTGEVFFDTLAYKRFVANDVVLCGIAIDSFVDEECDRKCLQEATVASSAAANKKVEKCERKRKLEDSTETPVLEGKVVEECDSKCLIDDTAALPAEEKVVEECDGKSLMDDTALPAAEEKVVLKFLKYGSGFFSGQFGSIIEKHILAAVIDGLEHLFKIREIKHIKAVEFPFYHCDPKQEARLKALKEKYGLEYKFSNDDALKTTWPEYITATTNCADPHAAIGNEMRYSSVDAAIASNLNSKGNTFTPLLNQKMRMDYIDFEGIAQYDKGNAASSL